MKSVFYSLLTAVLLSAYSFGQNTSANSIQDGVDAAHTPGMPRELFGDGGTLTTITNTLLFIVGALSVIMIIFGGLRYVISGGNSATVTAAKNTILYAIVGLIVAFLAFAAINFVLDALTTAGGAGTDR
jgi:hypothetical protein